MSNPTGPISTAGARTRRFLAVGVLCLAISTMVAWFIPTDPPGPRQVPDLSATALEAPLEMLGESFQGPLPKLTAVESDVRIKLETYVHTLAAEIGERNAVRAQAQLNQAADFIEAEWTAAGFQVGRQRFKVADTDCFNLDCEIPGTTLPKEIVVIGAHYDSVVGCPAANDNASGVAALLVLASRLVAASPTRTLRFAAFTNEEQPYGMSSEMGSLVYATRARAGNENIVAMLSLDSIGYYSDENGSQKYSIPLTPPIPSQGNYIAFVTRAQERDAALLRRCAEIFRRNTKFPCDARALPQTFPAVWWSDHWSFWQHRYPAIMVTDTAPFRYPYYHRMTDTPDKLDYERMARVVVGLQSVIENLVGIETRPPSVP